MVDEIVTRQELIDAQKDAKTLEDVINGAADTQVTARLGRTFWTLATLNSKLNSVETAATQGLININNDVASVETARVAAESQMNAKVASVEQIFDDKLSEWDDEAQTEINEWRSAIALITQEGGVPALAVSDASGVTQQEINDFVFPKLKEQFVSVWDFFTKAEIQAYNLAILNGTSSTFDSYQQVQAFFDYIKNNDVGTAYCSGDFRVSQGVVVGGQGGTKTKSVVGNAYIRAIPGSVIETLFLHQTGENFEWLGTITTDGGGNINWWTRTVRRGFEMGGTYSNRHAYYDSVSAIGGFSEIGILVNNNTTGSCIDSARATRCGSGYEGPNFSVYTDFTILSENRVVGVAQYTDIVANTLPEFDPLYQPMLKINGELYHVQSIDRTTNTVRIFPLLDNTVTSLNAKWIFGAGVATRGSDASAGRINKITGTNNGITYHTGALYSWAVGAMTSEANCIDLLIGGNSVSQAHVGGSIANLYSENSEFAIVRKTYAQLSFEITNTNAELNLAKVTNISGSRIPTTNVRTFNSALNGITMTWRGNRLQWEGAAASSNENVSVVPVSVTDVNRAPLRHIGDGRVFNIAAPDLNIDRNLGYNFKECFVVGTGVDNAPTGTVTFNAPEGYTVNGLPVATFNGFSSVAWFRVVLDYSTSNFIVSCLTSAPKSVSVTYDPPALSTGQTADATVTLVGAKVGDTVVAAFNRYSSAIDIRAVVSAADTVTVRFNNTGSTNPVDLASGTLTVKLI